jgi:hypothetical protein
MQKIEPRKALAANGHHQRAVQRQQHFLQLTQAGVEMKEALRIIGVTYEAYRQWRKRDKRFAAEVDLLRSGEHLSNGEYNGTHASFAKEFFDMEYSWFQLVFLQELEALPPGNILMALWPPEHGKTTTYENYVSEMIALNPNRRQTVASENHNIARKIIGRIKNRMEPNGPFPRYVERWGPFKPPIGLGQGKVSQPWGADHFNVFKKSQHDERDYTMMALGVGSSIVSTRTDHLHIDDVQSVKTLSQTNKIEDWFRQDALTRPGEHGITTIAGTRVGEDDIYSRLADDTDLHGILKVIKFKAIMSDFETGEEKPLWPERYTLDMLDRQRRKVGQDAWDRNYMQSPGSSNKNRTFTDEMLDNCFNPLISLAHPIPTDHIVYIGLDPALGSNNCVIACEVTPDNKLVIRRLREDVGFRRNEQIMQALDSVVQSCNLTGRVTDVVIESKNFQAGLARDERLLEMQAHYGFALREHLTGWNKYDENIGVASMCESFLRQEIVLPWAGDDYTRNEIGELVRQLKAWRPGARGNKLRQDRVMALWFVWILWRQRWKQPIDVDGFDGWKVKASPWGGSRNGLVIPLGAKL